MVTCVLVLAQERNFVELEQFDSERRQDMSAMLESFARIQVQCTSKLSLLFLLKFLCFSLL